MITILKKRRSQKNEVETVALLQDLIQQIDDPTLRDRILQETDKLIKQKKFGLVFEEHLPECTPLYDVPIRVGSKVALKTGYVSDIYTVVKIDSDKVLCDRRETHEQKIFKLDEIVVVAEFGEPIYPTLKLIDTVENAPDSDLWHTTGGYVGSKMYTSGLTQAKNTINTAFGSTHVLTHRQYLSNAVTNGRPSGCSWYDSTVELMTEQNVYGGKIFGAGNDGSSVPALYTVDKSQYPLFAFRPDLISNRQTFWLRDVVSAAHFAGVAYAGFASYSNASGVIGVRPAFSIKS